MKKKEKMHPNVFQIHLQTIIYKIGLHKQAGQQVEQKYN